MERSRTSILPSQLASPFDFRLELGQGVQRAPTIRVGIGVEVEVGVSVT